MAEQLDRGMVQLVVVLLVFGLWSVSMLVAAFDGSTMAKLMTPMMTMVAGWLFAEKASGG